MADTMLKSLKQVKRSIVVVIGFTILGIGIAIIVLPGPAILVIPMGLSILATEFVWAKRFLEKMKDSLRTTPVS
jgi:tellurite resistance protein TerC